MSKKKAPRFGVISTLVDLLQSSANVLRSLLQLALLELDLAKRSFVLIIMLLLMMFSFLIASWCYGIALFVYWLISLHITLIIALLIGFSINIILLVITLLFILHYRQDLTFPATRRQLQKLKKFI